jgi:hypothetical protein
METTAGLMRFLDCSLPGIHESNNQANCRIEYCNRDSILLTHYSIELKTEFLATSENK